MDSDDAVPELLPEETLRTLARIEAGLVISTPTVAAAPKARTGTGAAPKSHGPPPVVWNRVNANRQERSGAEPRAGQRAGQRADQRAGLARPTFPASRPASASAADPAKAPGPAEVQACLNKITEKTYEAQSPTILAAAASDLAMVLDAILRGARTFRASAPIFVRLVVQIHDAHPVCDFFVRHLTEYEQAVFALAKGAPASESDPAVDYDQFCEFTKKSDQHRAMAVFLGRLGQTRVLPGAQVAAVVERLLARTLAATREPGRLAEVETLSEIAVLAIPTEPGAAARCWKGCADQVRDLSACSPKTEPSFSSRVMFRYRDLHKALTG